MSSGCRKLWGGRLNPLPSLSHPWPPFPFRSWIRFWRAIVDRAETQIARSQEVFEKDSRSEAVRQTSVADPEDLVPQKAEIDRNTVYKTLSDDILSSTISKFYSFLFHSKEVLITIIFGIILILSKYVLAFFVFEPSRAYDFYSTILNLAGGLLVRDRPRKYQNKEALWRALILRVLTALRDNGGEAAKIDELERSLYEGFAVTERGPVQVNWTAVATEAIQTTISLAAVGVGAGFLAGIAGGVAKWFGQKTDADGKAEDTAKRVERVAGILQRKTIERAVRHVVSIEQFVDLFREAASSLGAVRRVYVLIDDLDRCLPENALEIFESVKLFLDSPKCAYVVAVDRAMIRRGLELRYPGEARSDPRALPPVVDPDEYIEKTITLSVDLPMRATR